MLWSLRTNKRKQFPGESLQTHNTSRSVDFTTVFLLLSSKIYGYGGYETISVFLCSITPK